MPSQHYDDDFRRHVECMADSSAARIVPDLIALFEPTSVVDVGCGTGAWLRAFLDGGVPQVFGVDAQVEPNQLVIPSSCFREMDLEHADSLGGPYDLALCLEVVEHLTPTAGERVVELLCDAAPVVVFSAAIPGQGGRHHVNEQWPDHWMERFGRRYFAGFDVFRARYWDDSDVSHFYAQNMMLFIRDGHPHQATARERVRAMPTRVVHPRTLRNHAQQPGIGDLLRGVPGAVVRSIRARRRS